METPLLFSSILIHAENYFSAAPCASAVCHNSILLLSHFCFMQPYGVSLIHAPLSSTR